MTLVDGGRNGNLTARAAAAALAVVLGVAGAACSGSPVAHGSPRAQVTRTARTSTTHTAELSTKAGHPVVTAGAPGCTTRTAAGPELRRVHTAMIPVASGPFGVAVSPGGQWAFVSQAYGDTVTILRSQATGAPVPTSSVSLAPGNALGMALTPGGRYLLAANYLAGATVIDVSRAERGASGAVLGTLSVPALQGASRAAGQGAIEVAVSPGGRFAFVSLERGGDLAVFNLQRALTRGFGPADFVGSIRLGVAPVGMAVSPDGRWLYATSEAVPGVPLTGRRGAAPGTLTVINLRQAETDPAGSVVSVVTAGCNPVRVIVSADGATCWVSARESDSLLAFSASRLLSDPAHALIARVRVGEAPVGLAFADHQTRILVADSDRFGAAGASAGLAVVSVPAALAGRPALLGYVPATAFPREMALEPDGRTLLVTNYGARRLEAVDVASLP